MSGPPCGAPKRPQRHKRANAVPHTSLRVQKLSARFQRADSERAPSNWTGRGRPEHTVSAPEDNRIPPVPQRARRIKRNSVRLCPDEVYKHVRPAKPSPQPGTPLSVKPPRTFALDMHAQTKEQMRPNPLYDKGPPGRGTAPSVHDSAVAHEYDEVCAREPSGIEAGIHHSRSEDHMNAPAGSLRSLDQPRELHMNSALSGASQGGPLSPGIRRRLTSQIRDAVRQPFSLVRQQLSPRPAEVVNAQDSNSEVSVREIQNRLVSVRSNKRAYTYGSWCDYGEAEKVFEFAMLVGYRCVDHALPSEPEVLHHFPKDKDCPGYDPVVVAHLCIPKEFDCECCASAERFFFTLVRDNGEKTFFHCLQLPESPKGALGGCLKTPLVLCLATRATSVAFYRQLLGDLAAPLVSLSEPIWSDLMSSLAQQRVPSPGCRLACLVPGQRGLSLSTRRPVDDRYDWARLTPLLGTLDSPVLIRILSSLILERRVILVSDDCTLLRRWVESVECLVYPFKWAHARMPLMPRCLLAQCSSPEPYLVGLPSAMANTAFELLEGPVLVVDIDRGILLREDEDNQDVVPQKLQQSLCTALSLAKSMTDPTGQVRDMMITEAFVRLFVELVGHCDQHIRLSDDGLRQFSFQRDAFIRDPCSRETQMFLHWFVETQAFEHFIFERAERRRQLARTPQHHLLPKGLFERRAAEHLLDMEHSGRGLRKLRTKVRTISDMFKNLRTFQHE